jgi:hypothetical protein
VTHVRTPQVTGPIEGEKPPWGAPTVDVDALGYVVEELFIGGTTVAFDLVDGTDYTEDGKWSAEPGPTAPYVTRLLVVRPRDAEVFNGTVVLNWQNVSAGYEYGALGEGDEVFNGYAWVGVSAQEVGVCGTFGGSQPFTDDELRALYPSRDVYVERWNDAVDALVSSGALRPEDAPAMKARAEVEAARLPY